jgi:CTD kinase subunit gamma
MSSLNSRAVPDHPPASTSTSNPTDPASAVPSSHTHSPAKTMSRDEIFKRIEADRERHKRLREKRWVQPIPHLPSAAYQLASCMGGDTEQHIDAEFEDAWETTSDWNEDDDEAAAEEHALCFPSQMQTQTQAQGEVPMDLT